MSQQSTPAPVPPTVQPHHILAANAAAFNCEGFAADRMEWLEQLADMPLFTNRDDAYNWVIKNHPGTFCPLTQSATNVFFWFPTALVERDRDGRTVMVPNRYHFARTISDPTGTYAFAAKNGSTPGIWLYANKESMLAHVAATYKIDASLYIELGLKQG